MPKLGLGANTRYFVPLFTGNQVVARDAAVLATSPIQYLRLNETTGTNANDSTANNYDGTYQGVTLNSDTTPFSQPAPLFDGVNDSVNIYSAGLASAFDFSEGAVSVFVKVFNVGVWTDATRRTIFNIQRDASNYVLIQKPPTSNTIAYTIAQGGTVKFYNLSISTTDWFNLTVSWSVNDDEVKFYQDGAQVGSTQTGLGTPSGTGLGSGTTNLGVTSGSIQPHHGYLAEFVVRAGSPADAAFVALGVA